MRRSTIIIITLVSITSISQTRGARDAGLPSNITPRPSVTQVKKPISKPTKKLITSNKSDNSIIKTYNPATDVSSGAWVKKDIRHAYYRESSASYDLYINSGVYLFALNTGLTTIWNTSGTNASSIQSDGVYDLVTNGGYFTYDKDINGYLPAGRIVDGLSAIRSMVWSNYDVNLWVTILYNRPTNFMRSTTSDVVIPREGLYAFYTGPKIIDGGQVMSGITLNISHRQRKAVRTFMIIDSLGRPHLGVSIQGYTLPVLAQKIIDMQVFTGNYQVINMDGGSSTALVAGVRSRNSHQRLPWFFGVKQ